MYTVYIFIVLGILGGIAFSWHEGESGGLYILNSISGAFVGMFIGFVVAFSMSNDYSYEQRRFPLMSLQDNNSVSGTFFLGCGSIGESTYYVCYMETSEGYKLKRVYYNDATIKFISDTPYIVYNISIKHSSNFALDIDGAETVTSYIFEVPKGTIKNEYKLDAQ